MSVWAIEHVYQLSLSARRAWIEMLASRLADMSAASLSARRAWIEISACVVGAPEGAVALRKESVDRNTLLLALISPKIGRSPQGERG